MWWDKQAKLLIRIIIATSVLQQQQYKKMYFKIKYCSYFKTLLALIICLLISGQKAANILDLYEGEICKTEKNSTINHVCKQPENCPSLEQDIRRQNFPPICSFIKHKPIVCCSPTVTVNTTNKKPPSSTTNTASSYSATEMCRQYSELVYEKVNTSSSNAGSLEKILDCHSVITLIVGGSKAEPKEFPHMALLGYGSNKKEEKAWACGGSLISNRWIMSAAHCNKNSERLVNWARLGELNIYSDSSPVDYEIVERVMHPKYNPAYVYNDIALFRLGKEVKFSAYIRPVCLNTVQKFRFNIATAIGWGRTSNDGPISYDLLKVDLAPISIGYCKYSYPPSSNPRINLGIIEDSMICAGDIRDGIDTCTGDSGGPLIVKHSNYPCMHTQIGITSFGKYCGNKDTPGIYTRVSYYIPWIEKIVWPKS
ncbi:venom protease-like [Rhopalosiphum padi]|uniref:venom protease-like n=1 Tax=Rhopalosiphum padi TaxID=40932 RepID=UPI00298D8E0F|nr:venom protease-like [Rhopalosiphum padi]